MSRQISVTERLVQFMAGEGDHQLAPSDESVVGEDD